MEYRRFGRTELALSVASLGTMRFACQAAAQETVSSAIAAGINHLETARSYGHSEAYLGESLRALAIPRQTIHLTSKLLPTLDAAAAERCIDASLKSLDTDYLDCLALHGVNTPEHLALLRNPNGCMTGIEAAMADGRVRHVGVSTHGPLEVVLALVNTGRFAFINLHYYLFFQRHAEAIAQAHQQDMGIFIISPADKGGLLHQPPPTLVETCRPYSPLALNYRFLLSDPRITTLSVGPATAAELAPTLGLLQGGQLEPQEQAAIARLDQQANQALGTSQCQQCYQCLPCPEAIHIPEVLRLRNLAIAHDMTDYGRYRYGMFENAGHWFPGRRGNRCTDCGDCLPRCPENLPIPALLQDADKRLGGTPRRRLWGE
ncbi:MAG: aldo/keto reductase [Cyanobacteria bacterium P01_A01_bin.135]